MPLIKAFRMDGLGNRFIIVDRRKNSINISKEKIVHLGNLKSLHRNIEFDQIIFIEKEINNTFPITIFNSDGGEVSACGNGSRCVAYLLSKDLNNKEIKLKTNNRLLNAKIAKTKKMRLDLLMPLVSGILSYDQKMKGKRPIHWKHMFQYFVKNLSFLIGYQ